MDRNRRWFLMAAGGVWGVLVLLSLLMHRWAGPHRFGAWPDWPPFALYAVALGGPIILLLAMPPLLGYLAGLPKAHRRVVAAIVTLLVFGQLANAAQHTFPFLDWQMFTRSFTSDPVVVYQYAGELADGSQRPLNPVKLIPPLDRERFYFGFQHFSELVREDPSPELLAVYDRVLASLAEVHNRRHGQPIVAVRVYRNTIHIRDDYQHTSRRELFRRIPVGATAP